LQNKECRPWLSVRFILNDSWSAESGLEYNQKTVDDDLVDFLPAITLVMATAAASPMRLNCLSMIPLP